MGTPVGLETMFCVDVLSFFLVLNETFGRRPKLCASDDSTSISSTYSPDCLCSSASDIRNFPKQPFMSSCHPSQGGGIAQKVVHTEKIILFFCRHTVHVDRGRMFGLKHKLYEKVGTPESRLLHTEIIVDTTS